MQLYSQGMGSVHWKF